MSKMKIIKYPQILEQDLSVEFFNGQLGNKDDYLYAMIKFGDMGYYSGYSPRGVEIMPTVEYSSHFAVDKVGGFVSDLIRFALEKREVEAQ